MNQIKALSDGCAFCGRPKDQVGRLFATPNAGVCEECVDSLTDILFKARNETTQQGQFTSVGVAPVDLFGEWQSVRSNASGQVDVRLQFSKDGLMISRIVEEGELKTMLMRYRVDNGRLVSAELVRSPHEKTSTLDIDGNTLTIDEHLRFERVR